MRRITKFLLLGLILICLGCVPSKSQQLSTVQGIVVDITTHQEDSYYTTAMVEFEDGRIIKLRIHYSRPIMLRKNKLNTITYTNAGTIKNVEVEE